MIKTQCPKCGGIYSARESTCPICVSSAKPAKATTSPSGAAPAPRSTSDAIPAETKTTKTTFDRKAYQREYMRKYLPKWRKRQKTEQSTS